MDVKEKIKKGKIKLMKIWMLKKIRNCNRQKLLLKNKKNKILKF